MGSPPGAGAAVATIRSRLDRVAGSALFAYGSIFLIQSKLLWGIWAHRDLSPGDTSFNFVKASSWAESLQLEPFYSPAYTFLWGSLQWVVNDPYAVTILHRILIAIGASLIVLAVLRRLLPPGIAWVLALWWVILPINYDTLYEVHLFALLPELAAVLIALTWTGLRMRSAVFAVLLATTVLVRNEILIALVVWTGAWLAYELVQRRRGAGTSLPRLARAVGFPLVAVLALGAVVAASYPEKRGLWSRFEAKQALNLCENYAFGYQQRHHDFRASPFAGCGPLSEREFGTEHPTLAGAVVENPSAIGEHFLWNARLVPYGMELLLFDRISAGPERNPDYIPVVFDSTASLAGLLCLASFVLGGLWLLWRERRRWWERWIRDRAWGWLALGSLAAAATVVMVWQRPRPSYLFALSVFILAVTGMCAAAYAERWPLLKRLRAAPPLLAVPILILLPPHYGADYQTELIGRPGRPLHDMVDRLQPFRDRLAQDDVRLLATYSQAACSYVGKAHPCKAVTWKAIVHPSPGQSPRMALDERGVDFIYADRADLADPTLAAVLGRLHPPDWQPLGPRELDPDWLLFARGS